MERKYLPKIIEYLFMIFANFLILVFWIFLISQIIQDKPTINNNNYKKLISNFQTFQWRLLFTITAISYITILFLSIHVIWILSKTEAYKWSAIISIIMSIFLLSVFAIIFLLVAYSKNLIVFE